MSSTQENLNKSISNDEMLDEIPETSVINYQNNDNNQNTDSDESFKTVENFEPIKLKFLRKFAKISGKISKDDLEELLLQKVTESMVYRTKHAEIRVKLDSYEELIQRQRTRIELLEKQYTDLEVTHERILTAMRENPQAPIEPLKIVRAVSCQVYQPTAEYVNSMPDPIVIGDSPKKKRTRRKNDEISKGKGRKRRKITEIMIDSSDEEEDLGECSKKVTRSSGKDSKKGKNSENEAQEASSSNKSKKSSNNEAQKSKSTTEKSHSSENEPESSKATTKSSETQVNLDQSLQTSRNEQESQKPSKDKQKSSENEKNSSKVDKMSSNIENSSENSNQSTSSNDGPKKGRKRKATTILDMIEKRYKKTAENMEEKSHNGSLGSLSKTNETNCKENEAKSAKNSSKSSQDSDSDNDVTIIEDDDEEPKSKRRQPSESSTSTNMDLEHPRVIEKLANMSKQIDSSTKMPQSNKGSQNSSKSDNITSNLKRTDSNSDVITSNDDNLTSKLSNKDSKSKKSTITSKQGDLTSKSKNSNIPTSSSPKSSESDIGSPERLSSAFNSSPEPENPKLTQKSFKVPTSKAKISKSTRPGPKCSKISNQVETYKKSSQKMQSGESTPQGSGLSGNFLKVSDKLLSGANNLDKNQGNRPEKNPNSAQSSFNIPTSATKCRPSPLDSATKSSNLDQSYDSLNLSTYSAFNSLSAFKSPSHYVTSTPLKAVEHGPVQTVKRTLDLNFNEKPKNDENSSKKIPPLPARGPQMLHPRLKQLSPAPTIKVEKVNNGIRIAWRVDDLKPSDHADIQSYQIYAYEELPGSSNNSEDWKLIGDVKALLLPMAVTLREFSEDQRFHFAVRGVDIHKRLGEFSAPKTWD